MAQFDGHSSCFGCRAKCKGQDPCAQGADTTQCVAYRGAVDSSQKTLCEEVRI